MAISDTQNSPSQVVQKKPIELKNLLIGAGLNLFETSTLGQPFEVTKTQMAADRSNGALGAIRNIYSRGGIFGFYQGLIPWSKCTNLGLGLKLLPKVHTFDLGSVLIFAQSELDYRFRMANFSPFASAILAGFRWLI
jgi:hypothetical protein